MLRKIFLISSFLLMIATVNNSLLAQSFYFGPKLGLNLSTISGYKYTISDEHALNGQFIGARTGIVAIADLYNGWGLQTEFLFSRKGHKIDLDWDTVDYKQKGYRSFGLSYLEIPVMAKKFFGDGGVRLYVNAGPYFGYVLSGSEKYKLTTYVPGAQNTTVEDFSIDLSNYGVENQYQAQRWDLGLTMGGGFAYDSGLGLILIDIRYSLGYRDFNKWLDGSVQPLDYRELKNKSFSLSFGYVFEIN